MMSAKLSVITGSILLLSAPLQGFSATTHPDSCMNRDWKKEIPLPVYPNREMVDLYHKTWEIAAGRVRKGPEGFPRLPIWMRIAMKIKYGYGIPVSWCFLPSMRLDRFPE